MPKNKPDVSIIIVYYKVKKELFACIESVKKSTKKLSHEIIVVDNDEKPSINDELLKRFPNVIYVTAGKNLGWGAGTQYGTQSARADVLYFLNPDCIVYDNAVERQYALLQKEKNVGVVSSLLLSPDGNPYPFQGTQMLTPVRALLSQSLLHTLFPKNPVAKRFWLQDMNREAVQEVDVVPLSSAMIKKHTFENVGGFDPKFFLYFEEYDLAQKLKKHGLKSYILPSAKVMHYWGVSSKTRNDINSIFRKSRNYYFQKYYGRLEALLVSLLLGINKKTIALFILLTLALFLRLYRLEDLMMFIGDFGWFYLSARDMLLTGTIPLVGITSSHTWLHQGPLWTYLLAGVLALANFNPISGAYLSAGVGAVSVLFLYLLAKKMFSEKVAFITALLYSTSPLIVIHSRMPYHTSPIPLFVMLYLYAFYNWILGNAKFFPVVIFSLSILYNFELATVILFFPVIFYFLWGAITHQQFIKKTVTKKIVFLSILSGVVPMIPILLYDFGNGFKQTIVFAGWMFYKSISAFGFASSQSTGSYTDLIPFSIEYIKRLLFLPNTGFAIVLFSSLLLISVYAIYKKKEQSLLLIYITSFILVLGFIIAKTPSEAYLPQFFPVIVLLFAYGFSQVIDRTWKWYLGTSILCVVVSSNIYLLLKNNYLMEQRGGYGPSFSKRKAAAESIISLTKGNQYTLEGEGPGSQFSSYTDNYTYLTWWLGHAQTLNSDNLLFTISENEKEIVVKKKVL